jgi:hypothetical protein
MKAEILNEGHRDQYYPSWGYGHLVRYTDGPRIGRLTRAFSDERVSVGAVVEVAVHGGLHRFTNPDRGTP